MELFFDHCPAKIVAITGADGKATSTTLASLFLAAEYGENHVYVGGNIGQPLLPRVKEMTENDFAVVELSSFQLMTMKKAPDIAIITNITPNHLNWHTGMDEYTRAKEDVFLNMKPGQRIVLNSRDKVSREIVGDVPEGVETLFFAGKGTCARKGIIYREGKEIMPVSDIFIRGRHNVENYEGVIAALGDMVSADKIAKIAREFKGVEHRIEYVRTHKGVEYYNSSIDSTPTRTAACLRSFSKKVIVICCGRDKHLPLDPLLDALEKKAKAVVVSGEAMDLIGDAVEKARAEGRKMPPCAKIPGFRTAVEFAALIAKEGDTVVLSPACTSFDAFRNFEERGKRFKKIIMELE
ncbi:MAG: UDP-N-acetylmuramoyl-L-alanine--D-glutamate ligase, partial [Firmicutes bacterium]|nr:UDP-N-acetylmuramoyl-L-alanine--D-glutamate ligase [Candidatus Colimorpha enterica]